MLTIRFSPFPLNFCEVPYILLHLLDLLKPQVGRLYQDLMSILGYIMIIVLLQSSVGGQRQRAKDKWPAVKGQGQGKG